MPSLRINKENQNEMHFITFTVIEWIDVFTKLEYFEVLLKTLKFCCECKGLLIYGYVFMTNHIHLLCETPKGNLIEIVSSFKRFTTKEIFRILRLLRGSPSRKKGYKNQIWQRENYPELVESEKFFQQKLYYIHENPVKEGYVDFEENWVYSSARNYYNDDHSILEVKTGFG